jgi:hypothetical protein
MTISRKQFIKLLSAATFLFVAPIFTLRGESGKSRYQIMPLEGLVYPPSFLRFCKQREFRTIAAAVAAVRNPELPFRVVEAK